MCYVYESETDLKLKRVLQIVIRPYVLEAGLVTPISKRNSYQLLKLPPNG